VDHLREVRGFATSTVPSHRRAAQCFLQHQAAEGTTLRRILPCHVESYVAQAGKRLSRASLQHDIAALRGFLAFSQQMAARPAWMMRRISVFLLRATFYLLGPQDSGKIDALYLGERDS